MPKFAMVCKCNHMLGEHNKFRRNKKTSKLQRICTVWDCDCDNYEYDHTRDVSIRPHKVPDSIIDVNEYKNKKKRKRNQIFICQLDKNGKLLPEDMRNRNPNASNRFEPNL